MDDTRWKKKKKGKGGAEAIDRSTRLTENVEDADKGNGLRHDRFSVTAGRRRVSLIDLPHQPVEDLVGADGHRHRHRRIDSNGHVKKHTDINGEEKR